MLTSGAAEVEPPAAVGVHTDTQKKKGKKKERFILIASGVAVLAILLVLLLFQRIVESYQKNITTENAGAARRGDRAPETAKRSESGKSASGVTVLGSGCAKCQALEEAAKAALRRLGMNANVGHVTDFAQIAAYGVMSTPALAVDGTVVSCGRSLKTEEIVAILKKTRGQRPAPRRRVRTRIPCGSARGAPP